MKETEKQSTKHGSSSESPTGVEGIESVQGVEEAGEGFLGYRILQILLSRKRNGAAGHATACISDFVQVRSATDASDA